MTPPEAAAGDAELLRRVARGDRDAFEAFYDRNAPWVAARLRRRCDAETATEVVQDTFVAAWRTAAGFGGADGSVAPWLWAIASRRLIDLHRRAAVRPRTTGEPAESALRVASAEDVVLADAYDSRLERALQGLSPELQAVLQATVLDGLSTREAAVLLGVPEGTVKSRAMRARRRMQEALS